MKLFVPLLWISIVYFGYTQPCEPFISIESPIQIYSSLKSASQIKLSSQVNTSTNLTLDATNEIEFLPGFEALSNSTSDISTSLIGCETSKPDFSMLNAINWNFDAINNLYWYEYNDITEKVVFKYKLNASGAGTFHAITMDIYDKRNNSFTTLYPSNFGGVAVELNNRQLLPWEGLVFNLLSHTIKSDGSLEVEWKCTYPSLGNDEVIYKYILIPTGRTMTIDVKSESNKAWQVTLDRSEILAQYNYTYDHVGPSPQNTCAKPNIISIPYLTNTNILLHNGNFVSMYFDYINTGASEITGTHNSYSATSKCFTQVAHYNKKTNAQRNKVSERIFLSVSRDIVKVLPNTYGSVSKFRNESANHMIFDCWVNPVVPKDYTTTNPARCVPPQSPGPNCTTSFQEATKQIESLHSNGINRLWSIVHHWQRDGFDNALPDVFFPDSDPDPDYGDWGALGSSQQLETLITKGKMNNGIIALHENYSNYHQNAWQYYSAGNRALKPDGTPYPWGLGHAACYTLKPSLASFYANQVATKIKNKYNPNSSFLDVAFSWTWNDVVDYTSNESDAGTLRNVISSYRELSNIMLSKYNGPLSVEGGNGRRWGTNNNSIRIDGGQEHLFRGWFDDVTAELVVCKPTSESSSGTMLPVIVDFNHRKLNQKAFVHGLGYYSRYFVRDISESDTFKVTKQESLEYIATTLAYGNGAFLNKYASTYNFLEEAQNQYNHLFKSQLAYGSSKILNIKYRDPGSGIFYSLSDYIRKWAFDYDKKSNTLAFASQIALEYENGVKVFVNRNPDKNWNNVVIPSNSIGWVSSCEGVNNLYHGIPTKTSYNLPARFGWLVYSPFQPQVRIDQDSETDQVDEPTTDIQVFPNPFENIVNVVVNDLDGSSVSGKIIDGLGREVFDLGKITYQDRTLAIPIDLSSLYQGIYIIQIINNNKVYTQKLIKN